jgi:hypothetical protein
MLPEDQDARPDAAFPAMTVGQMAIIRRLVLRALAERGVEATFNDDGTAITRADGHAYGLDNLVATCGNTPSRDWNDVVANHFAAMLSAEDQPGVEELAWPELSRRVRSRVLSVAQADDTPGDMLSYAWPLAEGLVEVLCVDYPEVVKYLNGDQVSRHDAEELRRVARHNTNAEPIDEVSVQEAHDAQYRILAGQSVFVGSKILDVAALVPGYVGDPSHGVIVGAPSRNYLMIHEMMDAKSAVAALNAMAPACLTLAERNPGPISGDLYFWKDGQLQRISRIEPTTQTISVEVRGALAQALEELDR